MWHRAGTGRQTSHAAPAAKHQRERCAGADAGQGAAAASGGRVGAGTRGHATMDPLRFVWLLLAPPEANTKSCYSYPRHISEISYVLFDRYNFFCRWRR